MAHSRSVRWYLPAVLAAVFGILVLSACSVATPLCDQAALFTKETKLSTAAQLYVQAQQQKEGQCADDGLTAVTKSHNDAFIDVARGATAENAGDLNKATSSYRRALVVDAENQEAAAGLNRVARSASVDPSQVAASAPSPTASTPTIGQPTQITTDFPSIGQSSTSPLWYWLALLAVTTVLAGGGGFAALWSRRAWLSLQDRVQQLDERLEHIKRTVAAHSHDFVRLDERLEHIKRTVAAHGDDLVRLENERRRIDRIVTLVTRGQLGGSREVSQYFADRQSDVSDDESSSVDQLESNEVVRLVEVRAFWVPSHPSSPANTREDSPQGQIVVECITWDSRSRHSGFALPIPDAKVKESDGSPEAIDRLLDAFDDAVTKKLMAGNWDRTTKLWVTPVCDGIASAAEGLSGLQDQWQDLILGKPVRSVSEHINLNPASGEALACVATELQLPGDTSVKAIKRMVQFTGIFIGVATGQPLLANACLKSLIHDLVAETISRAIGGVIQNILQPVGTREHNLQTPEIRDQHMRQLEELKREVGHQRQMELKREGPLTRPATRPGRPSPADPKSPGDIGPHTPPHITRPWPFMHPALDDPSRTRNRDDLDGPSRGIGIDL